jgi:hypothetical protein
MVRELEVAFEIPLGLPRIANTFSFTSIERSVPAKPATASEML